MAGVMKLQRRVLLATVLLLVAAGRSTADTVVFDNSAGAFQNIETRQGNVVYASVLDVSQTTTISGIGVQFNALANGFVKFLIFDSMYGGAGTGALLFSSEQAVTADLSANVGYLELHSMNFTLQAGKRYDIGVLSTVNLRGAWDITGNSQNGITSISSNANFTNYANPITGNYAGADPHIRLYVAGDDATVAPLPGVAAAGMALIGFGKMRRRRNAAAV
jgi:hypothetical protein